MNNYTESDPLDGIAIIGMSGRFPGSDSLDAFWDNLKSGYNAIQPIPDDKLNLTAEERETLLTNPNFVKMGSYVEGADTFDAAFFGIYPKEAEAMDPQHRLLLECAWEAFEDSGYDPAKVDGMVGVYAGCYMNTYMLSSLESNPAFIGSLANSFHGGVLQNELGNDKDYLATRISFKLNLRGPSLTIQTACSTSLVAIIQGCLALSSYQCDLALAGGATLKFPQYRGYLYEQDGMVAPDGKCRTFDLNARGTVFGDGAGMILMKRLEDAVADGDHIYAVIKGWGLNNDGASKVGYTAPSVEGQSEAIALAHAYAGFDASSITYVEAHGTGTPLGDPIEIDALTQAFRLSTQKKQFCAIGSLKTNLGHLDIAAGVAGIIKTALSLKNKQIPASLHFETPNPNIDFPETPFYVNTVLADWPAGETPRRAGLSSFGVGGTNAHVVLEEAPTVPRDGKQDQAPLITLSARSQEALDQASQNLALYLERHPETSLADVSFTHVAGRRTFNYTRSLVASNASEAIDMLRSPDHQHVHTVRQVQRDLPVIFMFPGQGSQHVNMGLGLYKQDTVFRQAMDQCADILKDLLDENIMDILYPSGDETEAATRLKDTRIAQPAIFMMSYSLAKYWEQYGIVPQAMIGHSVGEFVAACLGGVFTLEDALRAVATRGRLMQDMPSGSMLSIRLPKSEVETLLTEEVAIAAVNSSELCVVSGPDEAIEALAKALEAEEVPHRRLHTSHAFHSAMMDAAVPLFEEYLKELSLNAPLRTIVSTVTGEVLDPEVAQDPSYWARHLRETVQFSGGIGALIDEEAAAIYLEVGPGQTLSTLTRQHKNRQEKHRVLSSMPHARSDISAFRFVRGVLGQLWQHGATIDWDPLFNDVQPRRISLPTYPFERKRFWYEDLMQHRSNGTTAAGNTNGHASPAQASASIPANNEYTVSADVQQLLINQLQVMNQQLLAWNNRDPEKT